MLLLLPLFAGVFNPFGQYHSLEHNGAWRARHPAITNAPTRFPSPAPTPAVAPLAAAARPGTPRHRHVAPCTRVEISGWTGVGGARVKYALGTYREVAGSSSGGRPVYLHETYLHGMYRADGREVRASREVDLYMYFAPTLGLWVVGSMAPGELKRKVFTLAVGDAARRPEHIRGIWSYNNLTASSEQGGHTVGTWGGYTQLHAGCAMCAAVTLSGLKHIELHFPYMGVYKRQRHNVGGRPSYAREGGSGGRQLYIFWYRASRAWVASTRLGRPPAGEPFPLLVRSAAPSADRIQAAWASLRYREGRTDSAAAVERVDVLGAVHCGCASSHTQAPTRAPTSRPTPAPTTAPTPAPTAAPTPRATLRQHREAVPTFAPTPWITAAPTPAPTPLPVACAVFHLSGLARGAPAGAPYMGEWALFIKGGKKVEFGGRPVYRLRKPLFSRPSIHGSNAYFFYYAGMHSWCVGPTVGSAPFRLAAHSEAVLPQHILDRKNTWVVFGTNNMPDYKLSERTQLSVRCPAPTPAPTGAPTRSPTPAPTPPPTPAPTPAPPTPGPTPSPTVTPAPTPLPAACDELTFAAGRSGPVGDAAAGTYKRLPEQVGGHPAYQLQAAHRRFLYFSANVWVVGHKLGAVKSLMAAKASEDWRFGDRPDHTTGGWSVFAAGVPLWAPGVAITCTVSHRRKGPALAPALALARRRRAPTAAATRRHRSAHAGALAVAARRSQLVRSPARGRATAGAEAPLRRNGGTMYSATLHVQTPRASIAQAKRFLQRAASQRAMQPTLRKALGAADLRIERVLTSYFEGGTPDGVDVHFRAVVHGVNARTKIIEEQALVHSEAFLAYMSSALAQATHNKQLFSFGASITQPRIVPRPKHAAAVPRTTQGAAQGAAQGATTQSGTLPKASRRGALLIGGCAGAAVLILAFAWCLLARKTREARAAAQDEPEEEALGFRSAHFAYVETAGFKTRETPV